MTGKGSQIRRAGEIIEALEERGAEVRSANIKFVNSGGVSSAMAQMIGVNPTKEPVLQTEWSVSDDLDEDDEVSGQEAIEEAVQEAESSDFESSGHETTKQ